MGKLISDLKKSDRKKIKMTHKDMIKILEDSLSEEKKQIMDAFDKGTEYGNSMFQSFDYPASRYYTFAYEDNPNIKNYV